MAAGVRSEPYTRDILRLAADIPDIGRLANPDTSVELRSPTCGSIIRLDIAVAQGAVADCAVEIEACAFGQASTSLMMQSVKGCTPDRARMALAAMQLWLDDGGPLPDWPGMATLSPVGQRRGRHGAVLLPFRALVAALEGASA